MWLATLDDVHRRDLLEVDDHHNARSTIVTSQINCGAPNCSFRRTTGMLPPVAPHWPTPSWAA